MPMPEVIPSDPVGLSEQQAQARLAQEGPNALPSGHGRSLLRIAFEVLREPMLQLLVAAGLVYLWLGDRGEAAMLVAAVVLTVSITIVQERRSERVLEALRDLSSPRALVIRSGTRRRIAGREVVRGDVLVLSEGDRVPADASLLSANDLQTDESLLSGESLSVSKRVRSSADEFARPGGEDLPFVYSGTLVVRGQGIAEVIATGARSELGRIGKALEGLGSEVSPLHRKTRRLVRVLASVGLGASLCLVLFYGIVRGSWLDGLLAGITLAMSMLPEEIPLVLTVFMVMGAWRLSRHRVLTRRSAAIETLGSATVLCTDKTGTLTQNRMSIGAMELDGASWSAGDAPLPREFHALLEFGILASEIEPFDPMDRAFVELGRAQLAGGERLHERLMLEFDYGFRRPLMAMTHAWRGADGGRRVIATKGAPEAIADLCHLDGERLARVRDAALRLAERGLRVLAVARASFEGAALPAEPQAFAFEFLGLVGLADPIRDSVPTAVAECRRAGIDVLMITGDYPATALAIARQAGIDTSGGVLDGLELERSDAAQLQQRLAQVRVFARILPEQKLRLVESLKARGEIVAMTGDGVNDAPSLKAAHIGIAMGGRGTDVAREAASLVLLDDDFGSIVQAARQGRRILDNVTKAMGFILAVHVPIAGLSLLPVMLGGPLFFTPVHLAFLELIIDPVCSIVFEAETEEGDVMARPPRSPLAPLFPRALVLRSLLQGACVLLFVGLFLLALMHLEVPQAAARGAGFTALVVSNFGLIAANRSFQPALAGAWARPNPAFWRILAATAALLGLALLVPPVRELFHFGPASPALIASAIGVGLGVFVVLELLKPWTSRR